MKAFTQFSLEDRNTIESELNSHTKVSEIARLLHRSQSSIQREITRHTLIYNNYGWSTTNDCANVLSCKHHHLCNPNCYYKKGICKHCGQCHSFCTDYIYDECPSLLHAPHICNGCEHFQSCRFSRHIYRASKADSTYRETLIKTRSGINLSELELARLDLLIKNGLDKNQSLYHIVQCNTDEFNVSIRSLYNYIALGLLSSRNIDLPRKCRLKPRKSKPRQCKVDRTCRTNRTYEDFNNYMEEHSDTNVVEMDTVEGVKGGKVILTLYFRNCGLQLYYLRDNNTSRSVIQIIDELYRLLGNECFTRLFSVILTDNGTEFSNPSLIEVYPENTKDGSNHNDSKTRVFYCNAGASFQKGACERNHEFYRYYFPKGTSFNDLDQQKLNIISSNLNSYKRKKLNGQSPAELFSFLYGHDVLTQLGLTLIEANDVDLSLNVLK